MTSRLNMWTRSNKQTKTSYQHIITTHIDTRYMWKPIKGENHDFIIVMMQRQTPTPYYIWFSVGSNLQEAATSIFCTLQHARKLQLPYFFYRLQPTGGSYLNRLQPNVYQATIWMETTISWCKQETTICWFPGHKFCISPSSFLPLLPFKSASHKLHMCQVTNA